MISWQTKRRDNFWGIRGSQIAIWRDKERRRNTAADAVGRLFAGDSRWERARALPNNLISDAPIIIPLVRRNRPWLELTARGGRVYRSSMHDKKVRTRAYSDWYRWLHPTVMRGPRTRRRARTGSRVHTPKKKGGTHSGNRLVHRRDRCASALHYRRCAARNRVQVNQFQIKYSPSNSVHRKNSFVVERNLT